MKKNYKLLPLFLCGLTVVGGGLSSCGPDNPPGPPVNNEEEEIELTNTMVYAVGDSTVCSFNDAYYYPRYGYATQLRNYFDTKAGFNNLALSGRSSKSFIEEANYNTLKGEIGEGDYLIIGFGHNDEKSDDEARFTNANGDVTDSTSFKYYLYEKYVKLALNAGATPILCTPIVRASTTNNYSGADGHITANGDYAQAIRDLGTQYNITVIDLTEITKNKYTELGFNEAQYYHAVTSGTKDANGNIVPNMSSVDKTHLNIYGAKFVAYSFAQALKNTNCNLRHYVLPNIAEPTKENDLVMDSNYKYVSYSAPNLVAYNAPAHLSTMTEGWYGVGFGDTGGDPSSAGNGFIAKESSEGVFEVGQYLSGTNKGKISSTTEGFAFLFRQVEMSKNFTITAQAKVLTTALTKQAGFGLMLRDDSYINLRDASIVSNSVTAGLLCDSSFMNVLFSRENGALNKGTDTVQSLYQVGDEATLTITRVGQSITTTVVYNGETYSHTYYDFDVAAIDNEYMYVGMFATRGTTVEFTSVNFEITGESQGA